MTSSLLLDAELGGSDNCRTLTRQRYNGVKPNCWRLVCCCKWVYKGLLLHGVNSPLKDQGGQDVERKRGMKLKKQGRTFSLT